MSAGAVLQISAVFCAAALSAHAQDASHAAADRLAPQQWKLRNPANGKITGFYDPASGAFSPLSNESQSVVAVHETVTFKPSFVYRSTPKTKIDAISCSITAFYDQALNAGATGSYYASVSDSYTPGKTIAPISLDVSFESSAPTPTISYTLSCSANDMSNIEHQWEMDFSGAAISGTLTKAVTVNF